MLPTLVLMLSTAGSSLNAIAGPRAAAAGATCGDATDIALGTSDLGGNGAGSAATTVVNLWTVRTVDGKVEGTIAKTHDGSLWYDPAGGAKFHTLTDRSLKALLDPKQHRITGCFRTDLHGRTR